MNLIDIFHRLICGTLKIYIKYKDFPATCWEIAQR